MNISLQNVLFFLRLGPPHQNVLPLNVDSMATALLPFYSLLFTIKAPTKIAPLALIAFMFLPLSFSCN